MPLGGFAARLNRRNQTRGSVHIFALCSPYTWAHGRGTGIDGSNAAGWEDLREMWKEIE
jgi:hypothetical protein